MPLIGQKLWRDERWFDSRNLLECGMEKEVRPACSPHSLQTLPLPLKPVLCTHMQSLPMALSLARYIMAS